MSYNSFKGKIQNSELSSDTHGWNMKLHVIYLFIYLFVRT